MFPIERSLTEGGPEGASKGTASEGARELKSAAPRREPLAPGGKVSLSRYPKVSISGTRLA